MTDSKNGQHQDELSDGDLEDVAGGGGHAILTGAAAVVTLGKFIIDTARSGDERGEQFCTSSCPIITDEVRNAGRNGRPT